MLNKDLGVSSEQSMMNLSSSSMDDEFKIPLVWAGENCDLTREQNAVERLEQKRRRILAINEYRGFSFSLIITPTYYIHNNNNNNVDSILFVCLFVCYMMIEWVICYYYEIRAKPFQLYMFIINIA